MKFLPMMILGAVLGCSIYSSRFQVSLRKQMTHAVYSVLCFAFIYYVLEGAPISNGNTWPGALFWSNSFEQVCLAVVRFWNKTTLVQKYVPKQAIKTLTVKSITEYVWTSFYFALFFASFLLALHQFRQGTNQLSQNLPRAGIGILSTPAKTFSILLSMFFGFWIRVGKYAHQKEGSPIISIAVTLTLGTIGYWGTVSATSVRYIDLQFYLKYFSFIPALAGIVGLISGFPFVSKMSDKIRGKRKDEGHSGFILGNTFEGLPYRLTEKNLGYHVEIVAPTGSGKTNLLKSLIADRIAKGHGVIFLDYKAEFDMVSWIYRAAKNSNRENEIRLLSLSNRDLSVPYNPIKEGDATDIHSALMNAMTWSEQYYRAIASVALMTLVKALCEYRDHTHEYFHFGHLYELLDQPGLMRSLSDRMGQLNLPGAEKLAQLASRLDKPSEREKLTGLMANLNQLLSSSAGELLSTDVTHGSYGIREAISECRISVLLMNSLKLKESAKVVGKIILQDLIRYVGDHYAQIEEQKVRPITLIIDEFANFASPEFIELLDRARGAGIGIVMAHQARADLRVVSPEFQERIEANSNTILISGVKSQEDAEYYSGMLGTKTVTKETNQKREGLLGDQTTGMKSTRQAEEFVLHPNTLRTLQQGQVFAMSKTIDPRWGLVKVEMASEFSEQSTSNLDLIQAFKAIRASIQRQKGVRYLNFNALNEDPARLGSDSNANDLWA